MMIDDPRSRFHQKAVEGVLNRTGFHEIKETKQTVDHKVDTNELIAQIKSRLERLGLALPAASLGLQSQAAPTVQDGDVVEAAEGTLTPYRLDIPAGGRQSNARRPRGFMSRPERGRLRCPKRRGGVEKKRRPID